VIAVRVTELERLAVAVKEGREGVGEGLGTVSVQLMVRDSVALSVGCTTGEQDTVRVGVRVTDALGEGLQLQLTGLRVPEPEKVVECVILWEGVPGEWDVVPEEVPVVADMELENESVGLGE